MKYEIAITPVAKPRMTKSDRWKKRPATTKYWNFKAELAQACNEAGYVQGMTLYVTIGIQMPKSWKKSRRIEMLSKPHDQKPDWDNYAKAICDCLMPDGDEKIHTGCVNKVWSEHPSITFYDTIGEWLANLDQSL